MMKRNKEIEESALSGIDWSLGTFTSTVIIGLNVLFLKLRNRHPEPCSLIGDAFYINGSMVQIG